MNYIPRHIEDEVRSLSTQYPVVMLCGPRQAGKSTMLYHIKEENRRYVTLDDIDARRLAEDDPALFFETYGSPLLIDEFQRVPSLLLEIKRIVDRKALEGSANSGMFWLTGSQQFSMMRDISESLAGRVAILTLAPLSTAELERRDAAVFIPDVSALKERLSTARPKNIHEIYERIFNGGMPGLLNGTIERERYYSDYVNTYIERDIRALSQLGKLREFRDFLAAAAARTAQELKYEELARVSGVSAPTAKEWLSLLEASGLVYLLRPYHANISKRLVKRPKLYFADTGLAAYLCRWPSAATLENGAMDGAFLETYVVTEILKSYYAAGKEPDLYYYRDVDGKEVDLLFANAERIYPLEIKKSKHPANADRNFKALKKFGLALRDGIILCAADELIPYRQGSFLCPLWAL